MAKEGGDLFKPRTFKEKLVSRTPDILCVMLITAIIFVVFNARKNGYIPNNNMQKTLKRTTETKQLNTVLFNDSINQNIR